MSRTRRAQTALEFIIMMSAALILGAVFLFSALALLDGRTEEERITSLNDVGYTIQDELILAQTVSDGYSRTFTVPQLAGRFTYELTSTSDYITISSGRMTIVYEIPAITGVVAKGRNTVTKDGIIEVTQ